jgi:hypothetical protein
VALGDALQRVQERKFGSMATFPQLLGLRAGRADQSTEEVIDLVDRLYECRLWLRELLFAGNLLAFIFTDAAELIPVPRKIWGSSDFSRVMSTGVTSIVIGRRIVSGRVLIDRAQFMTLLEEATCSIDQQVEADAQRSCAPDNTANLHRSSQPRPTSARAETEAAATLPPYLSFMLGAARDLGASRNRRLPKQHVVSWLEQNWPRELGSPSGGKLEYMATFLRCPEDERGGHFRPVRKG